MVSSIEAFHGRLIRHRLEDVPSHFGRVVHVETRVSPVVILIFLILPPLLLVAPLLLFMFWSFPESSSTYRWVVLFGLFFIYLLPPCCLLVSMKRSRPVIIFTRGVLFTDGSFKSTEDITAIRMVNCNPTGHPFPHPPFKMKDPWKKESSAERKSESAVLSFLESKGEDQGKADAGEKDGRETGRITRPKASTRRFSLTRQKVQVMKGGCDQDEDGLLSSADAVFKKVPNVADLMDKKKGHEQQITSENPRTKVADLMSADPGWYKRHITLCFKDRTKHRIDDIRSIFALYRILGDRWDSLYQEDKKMARRGADLLREGEHSIMDVMPYVEEESGPIDRVNPGPYHRIWMIYLFFLGLFTIILLNQTSGLYDTIGFIPIDAVYFVLDFASICEATALIVLMPIVYFLIWFVRYHELDQTVHTRDGRVHLHGIDEQHLRRYVSCHPAAPELLLLLPLIIPGIMFIFSCVSSFQLAMDVLLLSLLLTCYAILRHHTPLFWAKRYVRTVRTYEHYAGSTLLQDHSFRFPRGSNAHVTELPQPEINRSSHAAHRALLILIPLILLAWFLNLIALVDNDELLWVFFFMDLYLLVIWFIYLLGKALTGSFGGIAKEAIRFEFATGQRVIPDSGFLYTAGLGSVREERRSH